MDIKTISGIDTLYYFYQTNHTYEKLFSLIQEQLEKEQKQLHDLSIEFTNRDINISINGETFTFNGKSQGFYWFTNLDEYFTLGFKDHYINTLLHDIQVQLSANGIYKIGIKSLIEYIDTLLSMCTTGYKPVTRADLNIFVQHDLGFLDKSMFVSRKRNYTSHIKEIATKYKVQTLYIGKRPFLLRIYDKKEELKNSYKKELMRNYFQTHGLDYKEPIFNVEFEMHRTFLKSYKIDTVDDLLSNAEQLFHEALELIRLVDLSTISKNSINNKNRYKALTHPLWEHLRQSYRLKQFLTNSKPLVKQKRKQYLYTVEQAINEHIQLANKAQMRNVIVDLQFYQEVLKAQDHADKL